MTFSKTFEHNEALFDAAIEEFSSAGYELASINTILKHAGMSKGQFYYHFKNKEDVYLALVGIMIEQKQAFMAEVMKPEDFNQDIFTILETQIQHGIGFARRHPSIQKFSESFLMERGNAIYDLVLERFNFNNDAGLNQLIEHAYMRGEFRAELSLPYVQRLIGFLFSHVTDLIDLLDYDNAEENLSQLVTFMKIGLAQYPQQSEE